MLFYWQKRAASWLLASFFVEKILKIVYCCTMATRKHLSKTGDYGQVNKIRAEDFGIDISMLIDNSKRTPTERIRRHQIALNTVEKLRKAKHI